MTLKEYLNSDDPNLFWRLESGDHLNLLDEAIEEIEQLQKKNDRFKKYVGHTQLCDIKPCTCGLDELLKEGE